MKFSADGIRFHCIGFHDRRSAELKARGDALEAARLEAIRRKAQDQADSELEAAWRKRVAANISARWLRAQRLVERLPKKLQTVKG